MGILDITDQFCNPIDLQKNMNSLNGEIYSEGKIHEQPIVSFVQKENEKTENLCNNN